MHSVILQLMSNNVFIQSVRDRGGSDDDGDI